MPGLAEHLRRRQVAGLAVAVEVDADVVAADGFGVDRHPPGPVLHALAGAGRSPRRAGACASARRPARGPTGAPAAAPRIAAWVPPSAAAGQVAQRHRRGAARDRRRPRGSGRARRRGLPRRRSAHAVRWMTAGLMKGEGVIGVTTSPCALKRGAIAIGLTVRTRCAWSSSTISAAGVGGSRRVVDGEDLGEALQGAAGDDVRGPDLAVGERQVGVEVGDGELLAPALARGLGGEQDEQVGRQRLEAAGVDDLDARLLGALAGGARSSGARRGSRRSGPCSGRRRRCRPRSPARRRGCRGRPC